MESSIMCYLLSSFAWLKFLHLHIFFASTVQLEAEEEEQMVRWQKKQKSQQKETKKTSLKKETKKTRQKAKKETKETSRNKPEEDKTLVELVNDRKRAEKVKRKSIVLLCAH